MAIVGWSGGTTIYYGQPHTDCIASHGQGMTKATSCAWNAHLAIAPTSIDFAATIVAAMAELRALLVGACFFFRSECGVLWTTWFATHVATFGIMHSLVQTFLSPPKMSTTCSPEVSVLWCSIVLSSCEIILQASLSEGCIFLDSGHGKTNDRWPPKVIKFRFIIFDSHPRVNGKIGCVTGQSCRLSRTNMF